MKTKLCAIILSLMMLLVSFPAHAAELAPAQEETAVYYADDTETLPIMPRWIAISQISHGVTFSGSTANISSNCYSWYSNYKVYTTVTLQKVEGVVVSDVKSWSGNGTGSAHVSETYTVSSGTYRVKTTVSIYNGSSHVETTTVYSATKTK